MGKVNIIRLDSIKPEFFPGFFYDILYDTFTTFFASNRAKANQNRKAKTQ
jgi:hypothetical protein